MFPRIARHSRTARGFRIAHAGAFAAIVLVLATACASPGHGPRGSSSESSATGSDPAKELQSWQLRFAQCMRGEGIDMPDPTTDDSVAVPASADSAEFDAASTTCIGTIGNPPAGSTVTTDPKVLEQQLTLAQCLRDQGIDVEDPRAGQTMSLPADIPQNVIDTCLTPAGN